MAQGFQIEGKIHQVNDVQTFDSGFSKREFVVETIDQYPQMIKFELLKDKTNLTDSFNQGDSINVHFDIRGNEYQGKYYVNLVCWKVEQPQAANAGGPPPQQAYQQPPQQQGGYQQPAPAQPAQNTPPPQNQPAPQQGGNFQDDDDIPF